MTQESLPPSRDSGDELAAIQHLQFTEREQAEHLLQQWFARHMNVQTEHVTLKPKAVSLNSFNGYYQAEGKEYFFKTHVESHGILAEYYNAEMLYQAGYNIVRPLRIVREAGQQMAIYPVMHWPVMFDLIRAIETGNGAGVSLEEVAAAEKQECSRLLDIYQSTAVASTTEEHASAPIHQLFWHRLAGDRFKNFYAGKLVPFPPTNTLPCGELGDSSPTIPAGVQRAATPLLGFGVSPTASPSTDQIPFDELLCYTWVINGVPQRQTLGELIERAKVVLNPARAATTTTIIGHGDAHFGNVFLEHPEHSGSYLYFDPAFGGRHSPLQDVVKPLFHNVYATWLYFPDEVACDLDVSVTVRGKTLFVEHTYLLTPVRQALLQIKIDNLLAPLIAWLRSQKALPSDWSEILHLSLMCCPLLTMNLLEGKRFPATVSWLGLSQAVQIGNEGIMLGCPKEM